MANYNLSTRGRVADIGRGLRVDTAIIDATSWGVQVAYPLFYLWGGRACVTQIVGEITTVLSNNAMLVKYYFTPTGGVQIDLSAASATIANLAVGKRILAAGTIGGATTFSGIGASMWQTVPFGRGTSTYDGLSIAWAVTEFLHNEKRVAAKTLFATHYHELTELEMLYPRIKNYRVTVKEIEDSVIFLRKIERGGVDNSYGIHVAQMAGLPREVIERAREVLFNLEANELSTNNIPRLANRRSGVDADRNQLNIFDYLKKSAVEEELKKMNIENLTPLEALIKLNELKKIITDAEQP